MSHQAVNWAIEQKAGGPAPKATLWSIANYANEDWCSWPSQHTIGAESEQSSDTVQRQVAQLEEIGLVRRVPMRYAGRRSNNFYILRPSPYFGKSLAEIEPLLPRGYSPLVRSETVDSSQSDPENDTANSGIDDTANDTANDAASDTALVRQQVTLEPKNLESVVFPTREGHSSEAEQIADEIATIANVDPAKDAKWFQAGPATWVQRFLDAGYLRWHLIEGVKRGMATLKGRSPRDIKYFTPIWQRVRGEAETPAPPPEIIEGGQNATIRNGFAGRIAAGPDRSSRSPKERRWEQAWDNVNDRLARPDDNGGSGEDYPPAAGGLPESRRS